MSLLETDYKCNDYGRDSGYCKHCSKSAFDKSKRRDVGDVVQRKSRPGAKKNQGKEGGKLPPPATKNNGKCN